MELVAHKNVPSFLEAARPVLLPDEARHNLMFGICTTLVEAPDAYPTFHLWTVASDDEPVLAMLMTPPYTLLVGRPADPAALQFAAGTMVDQGAGPSGAAGARP